MPSKYEIDTIRHAGKIKLVSGPNYDGQEYTRMADNQVIALDEWGMEDFGVGSLDVKLKLNVQTSQVPTQDNDNDETIQIDVTVVAFKANAEKIM